MFRKTRTKIKFSHAIESDVSIQSIADTMRLSIREVKRIRLSTKADIKAVTGFLQTSSVAQKKMVANFMLRAERDYLKIIEEIELRLEKECAAKHGKKKL